MLERRLKKERGKRLQYEKQNFNFNFLYPDYTNSRKFCGPLRFNHDNASNVRIGIWSKVYSE